MMPQVDAYSTAELGPILGIDPRNVRERAKRENWQARPRRARGGGSEWLLSSMPKATLDAIIAAQLAERGVALPEAQASTRPSPVSGAASLAVQLAEIEGSIKAVMATVQGQAELMTRLERPLNLLLEHHVRRGDR